MSLVMIWNAVAIVVALLDRAEEVTQLGRIDLESLVQPETRKEVRAKRAQRTALGQLSEGERVELVVALVRGIEQRAHFRGVFRTAPGVDSGGHRCAGLGGGCGRARGSGSTGKVDRSPSTASITTTTTTATTTTGADVSISHGFAGFHGGDCNLGLAVNGRLGLQVDLRLRLGGFRATLDMKYPRHSHVLDWHCIGVSSGATCGCAFSLGGTLGFIDGRFRSQRRGRCSGLILFEHTRTINSSGGLRGKDLQEALVISREGHKSFGAVATSRAVRPIGTVGAVTFGASARPVAVTTAADNAALAFVDELGHAEHEA
mmetsp:Transcript_5087/g.11286  ORF Transcript_5087/g.11286 Transcript_5087/m.11286 type:complete len:317 (+) Transcript_5087:1486-2436(+)